MSSANRKTAWEDTEFEVQHRAKKVKAKEEKEKGESGIQRRQHEFDAGKQNAETVLQLGGKESCHTRTNIDEAYTSYASH